VVRWMAKDSTGRKILAVLLDGKPRSSREIADALKEKKVTRSGIMSNI